MPGPNPLLLLAAAFSVPASGGLLGYGPAPGVELIPYFLALLTWVGLSLAAVLLAPFAALIRRLRRGRSAAPPEPKGGLTRAPAPEASGEGNRDPV